MDRVLTHRHVRNITTADAGVGRYITGIGRYMSGALAASAVVACIFLAAPATGQWAQWGGPNRNFMVEAKGLADAWPDEGPRQLWKRELGEGFSPIAVDDGVLYTMYRKTPDGENEYTIALNAETGETLWEHEQLSPIAHGMSQYGPGPHASPLISGDRLFTVGTNAAVHCFDKKSGKVLWRHDMLEEFGAPVFYFGYSTSPIAYKNLVVMSMDRWREDGGPWATPRDDPRLAKAQNGQALIAFDQNTGEVAWRSHDYPTDYTSPILVNFGGQDQLVALMRREMIGVNPATGELLWRQEINPVPDENIPTPLWTGDGLLFCSAGYNSGSRVIKLNLKDGKTVPEQLWYNRKMRILQSNAIRIGDYVYGTSGGFGAILMVCLDVNTGKRAWAQRGVGRSMCVYADGKLIMLDEDGQLMLATVSPEGMNIRSRHQILDRISWTAPTLAGTTLYARDRKHVMALDLSAAGRR